MKQQRRDRGVITKYEITPEGYLRCEATVARVGIQKYYNDDGSERLELRPPEEVAKPESLATYGLKPHTIDHPPEFVNSKNWKKHQTGTSDSTVWYDKGFVKVALNVTDEQAKQEIISGRRGEISCGYTVDLVPQSGVWNGQKYDCIQTNIHVNHIASVRKGRAGSDVKAHIDNYQDDRQITVYKFKKDMPVTWGQGSGMMRGKVMNLHPCDMQGMQGTEENPVIEIVGEDGGSYYKMAADIKADMNYTKDSKNQDSQNREDALTQRISTLEAMLSDKREAVAKAETENSDLAKQNRQLKIDADNALNEVQRLNKGREDSVNAEVTKRLGAWNKAKDFLPKAMLENRDATLNATAIMRAAIENTSPDTKLDGASDEYIKGCFETILAQPKKDKTGSIRRALTGAFEGIGKTDSDKKQIEARKKDEEAWMITN